MIYLFVCLLVSLSAAAQTAASLPAISQGFQALTERVNPAVVQVITRGFSTEEEGSGTFVRASRGSGSGVVVDPAGYIITNAHVVGFSRRVEVLLPQRSDMEMRHHSVLKAGGKLLAADVIGVDKEADLAVLKIAEAGLPHLPFSDSEKLRQGHLVFAFGSPFGLDNSVTMGVVSSMARQLHADDPMIYIQTDAAINPGNSGGPLVDSEGGIVGINTFIISPSGASNGVGFAVPSNIVRSVFEQIRDHGHVKRGQIGVIAQTITIPLAQSLGLHRDWGVMISDVTEGSAAAIAGLQVKDIVVSLNGRPMENARQFGVTIYRNAGRTISVGVLRDGQPKTVDVAVLERPRDPDRLISFVKGRENLVAPLGALLVEIDEKVTPLLPPLRRLSGVVVAGLVSDLGIGDNHLQAGDVLHEINNQTVSSIADVRKAVAGLKHGQPVALYVERQGQLQYLVLERD